MQLLQIRVYQGKLKSANGSRMADSLFISFRCISITSLEMFRNIVL